MLSYKAFKEKHRSKYDKEKLSNAQIKKRYDDYKASYQANPNRGPDQRYMPKGYSAVTRGLDEDRWRFAQNKRVAVAPPGGNKLAAQYPKDYFQGGYTKCHHLAPGVALCPTSCLYMCALADPFDPRLVGKVGYPMSPNMPTNKFRAFSRGTFAASSTTGTAYVAFSPLAACVNSSNCISHSLTGYTETDKFPASFSAVASQIVVNTSNSPLNNASGTFVRIVAAGVRVAPVNKLEDTSGLVYCITQPGGSDLTDVTSAIAETQLWRSTQIHAQTQEVGTMFSATWSPTVTNSPYEIAASSSSEDNVVNAGSGWIETSDIASHFNNNLGILITGTVAGNEYWYEAYVHVEAVTLQNAATANGNQIRNYATPSYSDPEAVALISSSQGVPLNSLPKNQDGVVTSSSVASFLSNAAQGISSFANASSKIASAIGGNTSNSSFPPLPLGEEPLGGFLAPSSVTDEAGPLVEMLGEGGEVLETLAPLALL